ncbi:hypothetical protein COM24_07460 [Bacillus toyonensis]|uniref:Uncharacterized protein n=1 Tax=Bacillus thuringiensis TaxID=1428 RepID=A0A9X7GFT5_BACTU|nr:MULTISPECIES: hypothetical protein [Bacillus cereus group]PES56017.1 hypothetical protein CN499_06225 [Bacillus thuringiensis]PFV35720.1 hypothetical protein COK99_01485 [Bacillus thuringiensis]PGC56641.1 hypothetical protein COM24_07460 [Bacillus toyonensis]
MDQKYKLFNKATNALIMENNEETIREKVEEMLEDKVGLIIMLEQTTEEDNVNPLLIYLHSDNYDHLSDEELEGLANNSIDLEGTMLEQHEGICQYLDIYVVAA